MTRVRNEQPSSLRFGKYAIALHFWQGGPAQRDVTQRHVTKIESDSKIAFASFERDMLSYSYRREPLPFSSRVVPVEEHLGTVELRFPGLITYQAEGEYVDLVCPTGSDGYRKRELVVKASRTDFRSGVSVLHLVLAPGASDESSLNAYDIVKLSKLWELGEGVEMAALITVHMPGGPDEGVPITDFAERVFDETELSGPRVGTVHLVTSAEEWGSCWKEIEHLAEASEDDLTPEVVGIGGIIQGLLDFARIDPDELNDVFESPSLDVDAEGLFGIHKGTLVSVARTDRVYEQAAPTIGISPYLLISQAVLLHNELQLDFAEQAGEDFRKHEKDVLVFQMQQALNVDYLPNVFHYRGERRLYETGAESRGLSDRLGDLKGKLDVASATLQHKQTERRNLADDATNFLLVLITLIQLESVFPGVPLWFFVAVAAVLGAVYVRWRWPWRPLSQPTRAGSAR
jgi:hypothetical protein